MLRKEILIWGITTQVFYVRTKLGYLKKKVPILVDWD